MDIEKLKHTLFNVNHLCSHIELSRSEMKKINENKYHHIYLDVNRLLDIYICSLIDEFIVFEKFVNNEDNFYLSDTHYVLTPLFDYIKKFDSLRIKRNKILGHLNRDRKKAFAPWWKELEGKRFATTSEEKSMIFSTIKCIHEIFRKRFSKELDEVLHEYDLEIDEYEKYIMTVQNVDTYSDISPIIIEVQKRMLESDFTFTIMNKK
ncbi:hypothetical protein [uncultured Flavobacterium sp.]|uniref:hypothetical protein n=1 Tax=uncultured Flavobacterium sp. TaxID=165435 RepID=UPI0030EEC69B|tara:strand:+ start:32852 stop:33472 length:621 start_codon:yes stop_codon:yes gene_type:complete